MSALLLALCQPALRRDRRQCCRTLDALAFHRHCAPAQGALGLQTRTDDATTISIVKQLNDKEVEKMVNFERSVLRAFQGGCQLPLGVYCEKQGDSYQLWGALGQADQSLSRANFSSNNLEESVEKMVNALKKKASH